MQSELRRGVLTKFGGSLSSEFPSGGDGTSFIGVCCHPLLVLRAGVAAAVCHELLVNPHFLVSCRCRWLV
jgi:hypothetical protein